jgi:hypothetical protein
VLILTVRIKPHNGFRVGGVAGGEAPRRGGSGKERGFAPFFGARGRLPPLYDFDFLFDVDFYFFEFDFNLLIIVLWEKYG